MKQILLFLLLAQHTLNSSLPELLGMGDLIKGLSIKVQAYDQFKNPTTAYMLDPNLNVFLTQFRSRTEFCDYKCNQSLLNLPCFLLFGCNIQIRNFILMFLLPFFMLILTVVCCGKRLWSLSCWWRYAKIFLGIHFVGWLFSKCKSAGAERLRKLREKRKHQKGQQIQIQPPPSNQRMQKQQTP